jgi:hypothetical protein
VPMKIPDSHDIRMQLFSLLCLKWSGIIDFCLLPSEPRNWIAITKSRIPLTVRSIFLRLTCAGGCMLRLPDWAALPCNELCRWLHVIAILQMSPPDWAALSCGAVQVVACRRHFTGEPSALGRPIVLPIVITRPCFQIRELLQPSVSSRRSSPPCLPSPLLLLLPFYSAPLAVQLPTAVTTVAPMTFSIAAGHKSLKNLTLT